MYLLSFPASALLLLLASPTSLHAEEIRTYQFTPDGSLPYRYINNDVGGPVIGAIADVNGTFRVSLDLAGNRGTLLAIDDQLVNVHDIITSPAGMRYQPSKLGHDQRILTDFWPYDALPIDGQLKIEGEELVLAFSGGRTLPSGGIVQLPSYSIRM